MSEPELCPKCERELSDDAPRGLCPVCMLEMVRGAESSVILTDSSRGGVLPGLLGCLRQEAESDGKRQDAGRRCPV